MQIHDELSVTPGHEKAYRVQGKEGPQRLHVKIWRRHQSFAAHREVHAPEQTSIVGLTEPVDPALSHQ